MHLCHHHPHCLVTSTRRHRRQDRRPMLPSTTSTLRAATLGWRMRVCCRAIGLSDWSPRSIVPCTRHRGLIATMRM